MRITRRTIARLAGMNVVFVIAAVAAAASDYDYDACLSRSTIPLGTYAQLNLFVKNHGTDDIVVDKIRITVPVRYGPWLERRPVVDVLPLGHVTLKAGEIRFWTKSVPGDWGFTSLLLGSYTASVSFTIREGDHTTEVKRGLPYQIIEPGEEMALMRQRYTKEIEACDLLDGGKQVMVYQLDVVAADRDARAQVAASLGMAAKAFEDPHQGPAAQAAREAAMYDHPAYRDSLRFAACRGTNAGNQFDYDSPLAYLDKVLAGLVPEARAVDDLRTRTLAEFPGQTSRMVSYAVTVARREGPEAALVYLRSLDTATFNCADRAFYNEFVERITRKIQEGSEASEATTPSPASP